MHLRLDIWPKTLEQVKMHKKYNKKIKQKTYC